MVGNREVATSEVSQIQQVRKAQTSSHHRVKQQTRIKWRERMKNAKRKSHQR